MQALRLDENGELALAELEAPAIKPDELLIETAVACICAADVVELRGDPHTFQLPVTLGHEGAGTVAAVGSDVGGFQVGDRVAVHPLHPCNDCDYCRRGMLHLCCQMGYLGLNLPGIFADRFVVRQDRARHVPDDMDFATAALVEPVAVALEALARARLEADQDLLIIGDGPMGLTMERLAATLELDNLVIAGHHDFRLTFTRNALAVNTIGSPDPAKIMRTAGRDGGYDAVILAAPNAATSAQALSLLRPRGRLVVFSAVPGATSVDFFDILVNELEIVGACNDQDKFDLALEILGNDSFGLDELVTHRFRLQDYAHAFALAAEAPDEAVKVAFTFET